MNPGIVVDGTNLEVRNLPRLQAKLGIITAPGALTFSLPMVDTAGTVAIPAATSGQNGFLTSADWTSFNAKVSTSRSIATTAPLTGGGDLSANRTFALDFSAAWAFVGNVGFYGTPPVAQRTQGATLTNNITSGGSANVLANYADLTLYANDAAAIRNNLYQLGQTLKTIVDGLRALGLFS